MMRIINIAKEYEPILWFIFPSYSIIGPGEPMKSTRFIVHRDVETQQDLANLRYFYDDAIIISRRLFDEIWDKQKCEDMVVDYAHRVLHSRKKKVKYPDEKPTPEETLQSWMNFLFGGSEELYSAPITELFECFGSKSFAQKYIEVTSATPVPVVNAALYTFVSKVINDPSTTYYLRKNQQYGAKVKANVRKAIEQSKDIIFKDPYGLYSLKFFMDLFT